MLAELAPLHPPVMAAATCFCSCCASVSAPLSAAAFAADSARYMQGAR